MGGVFDREFTKSLIIRDFDDVLKNPCFPITHIVKKNLTTEQLDRRINA